MFGGDKHFFGLKIFPLNFNSLAYVLIFATLFAYPEQNFQNSGLRILIYELPPIFLDTKLG